MRESSAQALGVVMQFMQPELIKSVSNVLLQLLLHEQWEVRHGGLLAVKYMLAVRKVGMREPGREGSSIINNLVRGARGVPSL